MKHPIGSFVSVPFVGKSRQVGHITRVSRTGSVKVRAYNATGGRWMPNERTFPADLVDQWPSANEAARRLPAPPVVMVPQQAQQQQGRAVGAQKVERESLPALTETADDRDAVNIANAAHFTASIRVGGSMQTIRDLRTMAEAGASAIIMERKAGNGRGGIVYAVTAEGRSAMVKRAVWEAEVARALAALPPL